MRGERPLNSINGMDCVAHDEIIPYRPTQSKPIQHDMFERIFEMVGENSDGLLAYFSF